MIMRKILLMLLMCVSLGGNAQEEKTFNAYCLVHIYGTPSNYKIELQMPDTEGIKHVINEEGDFEWFMNMADAMTYLGKKGWVFEYQLGGTVGWLVFSKKIKNMEEAKDGILLGDANNNKKKK